MRAAIAGANGAGVPWVLDPVAIGALPLRTGLAREFAALHPAVIRGNASEIGALAGGSGGRGVDSTATPDEVAEVAVGGRRQLRHGGRDERAGRPDHRRDPDGAGGVRHADADQGHRGRLRAGRADRCVPRGDAGPDHRGRGRDRLGLRGRRDARAETAAGVGAFAVTFLDALDLLSAADDRGQRADAGDARWSDRRDRTPDSPSTWSPTPRMCGGPAGWSTRSARPSPVVSPRCRCAIRRPPPVSWSRWPPRCSTLLRGTGIPLIVNDRVDVALAVGADGVHVGQQDLHSGGRPPAASGPERHLGLSISDRTQLPRRLALPAGTVDLLGVGPIRDTPSKTDAAPALGFGGLAAICAAGRRCPCVAIGGLRAADSRRCQGQRSRWHGGHLGDLRAARSGGPPRR